MSYEVTGRRRPTKVKKQINTQKRKRDDVDVHKLEQAVNELDATASVVNFADLPLSDPTKAGLKACHFTKLTDIQARSIPLSLKGKDILGAAKTGSGKTLAFIIPVLENLYRAQCIGTDAGLGAMIISPTRELAIQIFDVLHKIGKHGHLFAAGLIIGGKSLQEEQQALSRMNIVVCTPGRMLQHLSQTASFSADNLRMLVLDEADRILDMGFQRDVDAIIEYLPPQRQTLLFSATQTKRISDLARLSLSNPEYVSVHEAAASATPSSLQQNYVLTPLPDKLDTLWSFIKSTKKAKIIVFLSSGKQVRFVYECFRRLQPGIPLLHLHGRQKQQARLEITHRFSSARHTCLFATDIAARGLDFPVIDWVVQADCPEDADTYIHRVGRTARYERDGRAVLFLDPAEEEGMLSKLAAKKVPIEMINVRQKKQSSIRNQLQGLLFKDPELRYLGQKAFASYVRSLHLQKDKQIFQLDNYALEDFASSLGLPGAPRIRFMKGDAEAIKARKNAPRQGVESSDEENIGQEAEEDVADDKKKAATTRTKYDRMFERRNQDVLADHYAKMIAKDGTVVNGANEPDAAVIEGNALISRVGEAGGDEDDLFTVKRRFAAASASPPRSPSPAIDGETLGRKPTLKEQTQPIDSKRRARAALTKAATAKKLLQTRGQHLVFDESTGVAREAKPLFDDETTVGKDQAEREEARRAFVEEAREAMRDVDVDDRATARAKRQEKKLKRKQKDREEAAEMEDAGSDDGDEASKATSTPFAELADLYPQSDDDGPAEPPAKKKKKWFQDASSGDEDVDEDLESAKRRTKRRRQAAVQQPPETLEDMEELAKGLLG